MKLRLSGLLFAVLIFHLFRPGLAGNFDPTPFGEIRHWPAEGDPLGAVTSIAAFNENRLDNLGILWREARDLTSLELTFREPVTAAVARAIIVQYWQFTWPEKPPAMPKKEDLEDDLWRGAWITASTRVQVIKNKLIFQFAPLSQEELASAGNLPGVNYRRTLKLRCLFPQDHNVLTGLHAFSSSGCQPVDIRLEWCNSTPVRNQGRVEVFNGRLDSVRGWRWQAGDRKTGAASWQMRAEAGRGLMIRIIATAPQLPGSNDETIVTVRTDSAAFSFSPQELQKEPIYIPSHQVYLCLSSDTARFSSSRMIQGKTVRQKILDEPEQSYARARKEIPELDPTNRDPGRQLRHIYLPLANDASWQKFAVIWGGNILIDKARAKAKGNERIRCNWSGDELQWQFGCGTPPVFERTLENCQMSILHNYLPVVTSRWTADGLNFSEESFVTLLEGPLSPFDPARNEQTPAVLMTRLTVSNPGLAREGRFFLSANQAVRQLALNGGFLIEAEPQFHGIRGVVKTPAGCSRELARIPDSLAAFNSVLFSMPMAANSSSEFFLYFPFVGDLSAAQAEQMRGLDFAGQKEQVTAYWRAIAQSLAQIRVPDQVLNDFAAAVVPHIRMSATKDPASGLFMAPAGTLGYAVYANEACFQTQLLDRLGDHATVDAYLQTFMDLQGSVPMPGAFTGSQKEVFHGVRVDSIYNYTASGYNLDHGTVLWALARHYLYTHDDLWLARSLPHLRAGADWIISQRAQNKGPDMELHSGLLPAGRLEDANEWQYWYAVNAYAWLGLDTFAGALAAAGNSAAEFYRKAAGEYREDIRSSVARSAELSPVVRLRNGSSVPYVPCRAYQRFRYFGAKKTGYYTRWDSSINPCLRLSATRELLYGPLTLLKTGLIDPYEPMAEWILDDWEDNLTLSSSLNLNVHGWVDDEYWFSRGGMVFQANLQNPGQIYVMRHDIPAALRTFYNSFVSCHFADVNCMAEEYRMWRQASGHFYKIPDEARVVDGLLDLLITERADSLWLAAGTPRRWLESGKKIEIEQVSTRWGRVSYTLQSGPGPLAVTADIELPEGPATKVLFVRAPFDRAMQAVEIDGQVWKDWRADKEAVTLPPGRNKMRVIIAYQ